MLRHSGQAVLRQSENDSNRLQLGDNQQGIGIGSMDHIAPIHQSQAYAAIYRRGNVAVGQVELRVFNGGPVCARRTLQLTDKGLLRVHLLMGNNAGSDQALITHQVKLRVL